MEAHDHVECFPGCLLPSLCGECIDCDLGLGTHGFGFGHYVGWQNFCNGDCPLEHLSKKAQETVTHVGAIPNTQHKGTQLLVPYRA